MWKIFSDGNSYGTYIINTETGEKLNGVISAEYVVGAGCRPELHVELLASDEIDAKAPILKITKTTITDDVEINENS